jgi:hypothetical protein
MTISLNATSLQNSVFLTLHTRGQFHSTLLNSYGSTSTNIVMGHKNSLRFMKFALERTQVTKLDIEGNRCDAKNVVDIQNCLKKHAEDEIGCTIPSGKKINVNTPCVTNPIRGII